MHPILLETDGGFFIGTYGVLIALGLMAAAWLAAWRGKKRGYSTDVFYDITFIAVASGFLGARLLFILLDLPGFLKAPGEYLFSRTGFVFLGGLITAAAACMYYIKRKKLNVWEVADLILPSLALGHAFGRIGCHFSGCCYGGQCDLPFGISVPQVVLNDGSLWGNAYSDQLQHGLVTIDQAQSLPLWPVQLMESASLFILTGVLLFLATKVTRTGLVAGAYLLLYSVIRFILEFLRGDEGRGLFFGGLLSTSQIISIGLFIAGLGVMYYRMTIPKDKALPREPEKTADRKAEAKKAMMASKQKD